MGDPCPHASVNLGKGLLVQTNKAFKLLVQVQFKFNFIQPGMCFFWHHSEISTAVAHRMKIITHAISVATALALGTLDAPIIGTVRSLQVLQVVAVGQFVKKHTHK